MSHSASRSPPTSGVLRAVSAVLAVAAVLAFVLLSSPAARTTVVVAVDPAGALIRVLEPSIEHAEVVAARGEARFEGVPAGTQLRLLATAKGYEQAVVTRQLPLSGGEVRVEVKLASENALYTVVSEPAGAMIYVDGRPVGRAPAVADRVTPGSHVIEARLEGYEGRSLEIEASAGEHRRVRLALTALPEVLDAGPAPKDEPLPPGFARLTVHSTHPARFFVNNAVLGYGTRATRQVPQGRQRITARADGRGTQWQMVDVQDQGDHVVRFEFDEDPIEKAFEATDPQKPLYWLIRGGNIRGEGRYGDSVAHFKKALELKPAREDEIEIHRQLSRTLPALQRWDEAIEHTEQYLALAPESPDAPFARELLAELRRRREQKEGR